MAEIVAVVGVVANIVQLVDTGSKIIHRFHEFQRSGREIPKIFQKFRAELPLLQQALRKIKEAEDAGVIGDGPTLLSAIDGCQKQIQGLDIIITRTLPSSDDSRRTRAKKTIRSLCQESKVKDLTDNLQSYIVALNLYLAAVSATSRIRLGTSILDAL